MQRSAVAGAVAAEEGRDRASSGTGTGFMSRWFGKKDKDKDKDKAGKSSGKASPQQPRKETMQPQPQSKSQQPLQPPLQKQQWQKQAAEPRPVKVASPSTGSPGTPPIAAAAHAAPAAVPTVASAAAQRGPTNTAAATSGAGSSARKPNLMSTAGGVGTVPSPALPDAAAMEDSASPPMENGGRQKSSAAVAAGEDGGRQDAASKAAGATPAASSTKRGDKEGEDEARPMDDSVTSRNMRMLAEATEGITALEAQREALSERRKRDCGHTHTPAAAVSSFCSVLRSRMTPFGFIGHFDFVFIVSSVPNRCSPCSVWVVVPQWILIMARTQVPPCLPGHARRWTVWSRGTTALRKWKPLCSR